MNKEQKRKIINEFGFKEGIPIVYEHMAIEEHCRANNITEHSLTVDGGCNMGCC